MLNCDKCQFIISDISDAKFTETECLCSSCHAANGVQVGGLSTSSFSNLITIHQKWKKDNSINIISEYLNSDFGSQSDIKHVDRVLNLLNNSDFVGVSNADLETAVQGLMFFSNYGPDEAIELLKTGRTKHSQASIDLAFELVFN